MRVCDKHPSEKAVDTIHIKNDDQFIDVCDVCKFAVLEMLTAPTPPEKKRKPNLAQAN